VKGSRAIAGSDRHAQGDPGKIAKIAKVAKITFFLFLQGTRGSYLPR
jgi:hypothetical protein